MFGGYVVKHYFCTRIRERTQAIKSIEQKTLEKSSENIWNLKKKVLTFAATFSKRKR